MAMLETIVRPGRQDWSNRRLARELGIDRNAVSRHIRQARENPKPARAPTGSDAAADSSKAAKAPPGSEDGSDGSRAAEAPPRLGAGVEDGSAQSMRRGGRGSWQAQGLLNSLASSGWSTKWISVIWNSRHLSPSCMPTLVTG